VSCSLHLLYLNAATYTQRNVVLPTNKQCEGDVHKAKRTAWNTDRDRDPEKTQEDLYKASVVTANNSVTVCHIRNPQRCQMHMPVCGLFVINETMFRLPL
jgi:hypothetical protein